MSSAKRTPGHGEGRVDLVERGDLPVRGAAAVTDHDAGRPDLVEDAPRERRVGLIADEDLGSFPA